MTSPTHPQPSDRPWLYGLLVAPVSVLTNGIIQGGVLGFLMAGHNVSDIRAGATIALLSWPSFLYFLWSPITDFFLPRRAWLLCAAFLSAALMGIALTRPSLTSPGAVALMFLSAAIVQFVVAASGGMMGNLHSERARRVAASFYQAGGLGFGAIAVFLLISSSEHHHARWMAPIAAAFIALPALFALLAPRHPVVRGDTLAATRHRIWTEFKATFLRWSALPYTILLLAPLATGAAIGLLTGQARFYSVSGQQVAWMNGIAGALLMAAGSLCGSLVPLRVRPAVAYSTAGIINGAALLALWMGPMRPATYFTGVALYLFTTGFGYAISGSVMLEFLGPSGKSGSSRYSIINSLINIPVVYMIALDGWGGQHGGPRGLAATESIAGIAAGTLLLTYFLIVKKKETAAEERAEVAMH